MPKHEKLQFLYASLSDLQATIRAMDTKVNYLLVVLFLPLTRLGTIYGKIRDLLSHGSILVVVLTSMLVLFFVVSWFMGFWCALRTLIAIDDPRHHIDGDRPESKFYPAQLFRLGFGDVVWTSRALSATQFHKHYAAIPEDPEEIAEQLTLEQMKTMYILSLKLKRAAYTYYAAIAWISIGGVLWCLHLARF